MNKVFVSGTKKKSNNGKFKLRNFGGNKYERLVENDARTEYFPYAGGSGHDEYTYQDQHMSYEPADIMADSHVELEEPSGLGHSIRRVLVRGSKYDVYAALPSTPDVSSTTSRSSTPSSASNSSSNSLGSLPPELNPSGTSGAPPMPRAIPNASTTNTSIPTDNPSDDSQAAPLWTLQWLNTSPATLEDFVPLVRRIARETIVLAPVDMGADIAEQHVAGAELVFAGIESFLLMSLADLSAQIVHIACSPAMFITKLVWKLLT